MRPLLFALLCSFAATGALAQTPPSPVKAKAVAKASPKAVKKVAPAAAAMPAYEEPAEIDTERMAVAPMVLRGDSQCEFKQKISLTEHPTLPGRFLLEYNNLKYVLTPQPTTTGVIRLEDKRTGITWLQVPIKSMLMDTKKGQRLVDNCMHTAQTAEVEAMQREAMTKSQ